MDERTTERIDSLRERAYELLRASGGRRFLPVRVARGLLSLVNDMVGRPLAPREELEARRRYEEQRKARVRAHVEQLAEAEARDEARRSGPRPVPAPVTDEPVPVFVYVDTQSGRDVRRIGDVLRGRAIPFRELDVEHDAATRSAIRTRARGAELPVVVVGDRVVGGYDALVQLDATGELARLVFGATAHAGS